MSDADIAGTIRRKHGTFGTGLSTSHQLNRSARRLRIDALESRKKSPLSEQHTAAMQAGVTGQEDRPDNDCAARWFRRGNFAGAAQPGSDDAEIGAGSGSEQGFR
jgi:hypothetical protein